MKKILHIIISIGLCTTLQGWAAWGPQEPVDDYEIARATLLRAQDAFDASIENRPQAIKETCEILIQNTHTLCDLQKQLPLLRIQFGQVVGRDLAQGIIQEQAALRARLEEGYSFLRQQDHSDLIAYLNRMFEASTNFQNEESLLHPIDGPLQRQ